MNKRAILSAIVALGSIAVPLTTRAAAGATDVAGVPAANVGIHGPLSDYASGAVQLVGHTNLASTPTGKALGNNGGIALIGNCAFVGRWHDYGDTSSSNVPGPKVQYPIQIVDISNPADPHVVGSVPDSTIHDAVAREIRAVDLPPSTRFPSGFQLLTVQTFGKYIDEYNETPGQNALYYYIFPDGDCTHPVPAGRFFPSALTTDAPLNALRPHEFYQWLDPNPAHDAVADTKNGIPAHPRILDFVTTPLGGIDGFVVDATNVMRPALSGVWHAGQPLASASESNLIGGVPAGAGRYSHSITLSPDGSKAYLSQWDGGFLTLDSSAFAQARPRGTLLPLGSQSVPLFASAAPGNAHSAVSIPGTNDIVGGDEIYVTTDGCPFGWMHIFDQGDATHPPSEVSQFALTENQSSKCSGVQSSDRNALGQAVDGSFTMHNQTVTDRFVITTWYGGGLRVVDVSNPASPNEAGFFVPKPVDAITSVPDTSAPVYGATADPNDDWWVAMWSYPIIRNGYIYVSDVRNGLYILQPTAGSGLANDLAKYRFLEGNSNLGDFVN